MRAVMSREFANIHIDGAARGNPGPAAYAFVIAPPDQEVTEESDTLGHTTNNVAEYTALVRVLERARDLNLKKLMIHSDSELMVKQMNGVYRVKNEDLKSLYEQAQDLLDHFEQVKIHHVRREQNKRADELCNLALDGSPFPRTPSKSTKPSKVKEKPKPAYVQRCLTCLKKAKDSWAEDESLSVEEVWKELWQILEEEKVLRKDEG
jgi:ribonuclease HI